MEIEYLLIGHGMDGQIKHFDYPNEKLFVTEVHVEAAGSGAKGRPVKFFNVHHVNYDGSIYAVAIARSCSDAEVLRFIADSGVKPIPESLL